MAVFHTFGKEGGGEGGVPHLLHGEEAERLLAEEVGKALLVFCAAPLVLAVIFAAHDFGATRELKRRVERNPTLSRLALRKSRKPRATTSHDLSHDEDDDAGVV